MFFVLYNFYNFFHFNFFSWERENAGGPFESVLFHDLMFSIINRTKEDVILCVGLLRDESH